jgi:hypothetical protein
VATPPLPREEHEPEPTDLDLVVRSELGHLDALAVHVGPVHAPEVVDVEAVRMATDLRVLAADADVVEEHVALRVASGARHLTLDHERRPRIGAMLDQQEGLARLELVLRERELVWTLRFDLDRAEAEGRLLLQDSATVRAVASLVFVGMSTAGAVHGRPSVALVSRRRFEPEANLRPRDPLETTVPPTKGQP